MIKLVTISRISKEKGFERMLQLEALLRLSGIAFSWDCYGDTSTKYAKQVMPRFKHVKFKGVTQQPKQVMKQYNYLVQLSDTEGFPYSIYEAMQQKLPVIATDFPSIHEMITDGDNGYILDMDLGNFDPKKIIRIPVIKSFTEKSNEQDWINFLDMAKTRKTPAAPRVKPMTKITVKKDDFVSVKVVKRYYDIEKQKTFEPYDLHEVSASRAKKLHEAKVCEVVEVIASV